MVFCTGLRKNTFWGTGENGSAKGPSGAVGGHQRPMITPHCIHFLVAFRPENPAKCPVQKTGSNIGLDDDGGQAVRDGRKYLWCKKKIPAQWCREQYAVR
jgi:hypothetical protein